MLGALIRWELRLQLRSTRCKVAILLYLALCSVPSVLFLVASRDTTLGPTTFLQHLLQVQPFLTILLAALLAGHRSATAWWPEMWPVLASAPVSNAGYFLGRWLALVCLMVPMTALPFLGAAAAATAAGCEWHGVGGWVLSWMLQVMPLACAASAMWLGMVTLLGGELAALGMTLVGLGMAISTVNRILLKIGLRVDVSLTLGSFLKLRDWISNLSNVVEINSEDYTSNWVSRRVASEAAFDVRAMVDGLLPQMLMGTVLSLLVLGCGVAFVRRTRRDLKPRPVRPDHPVRAFLELFLRLRENLAPTAGLGAGDRLALAGAILVLAAGLALNVERQQHFWALAGERYQVAVDDPFPPLAPEVKPGTWKIRGSIEETGHVALDVSATLRHEGGEPQSLPPVIPPRGQSLPPLIPPRGQSLPPRGQSRLAFTLNEGVEVVALDVPGRRATMQRAWDRLLVTVEPPLAPGEALEIRWRLQGAPGYVQFPFRGYWNESFFRLYNRHRQARFSRDLTDLSLSETFHAASPRRLEMEAVHLAPVPRYTPWTIEHVERGTRGPQPIVPGESIHPEVDLELDLTVPSRFFVADACGHFSRRPTSSRLTGRCRLRLADYRVYGSPLEVTEDSGLVLAVARSHLENVSDFGESLSKAAALSDKAWPGMEGFDGLVVAEWVPTSRGRQRRSLTRGSYELRGKLLLLDEWAVGAGYLPWGEKLIADLVTRDLIARRGVDQDQQIFFENMYAALMLHRMGVARHSDGTIQDRPVLETALKMPLLEAPRYSSNHWDMRLPAVLVDLENRVGAKKLFDGLERFLSASGNGSGTAQELFALLEHESGVSLDRFYDDFIAGGAVPRLLLEDVEMRREGQSFRVTGQVRNVGTGQVFCPLLVKTEVERVSLLLEVDSDSSSPFDLSTPTRPFTVELDPEGTCHRLVTKTRYGAEHVDISG